MDKKTLTDNILAAVADALDQRAEMDDMAWLAISTADLAVSVIDDPEAVTEAYDVYPLIDLTLMDTEGNMHPDTDAIAEVAHQYDI